MTQGEIIQEAMDLTGEPNNPTSGKFSLAWWSRKLNQAQRIAARRTGYKIMKHPVSVATNLQFSTLPSALCWGILSVHIGTSQLFPVEEVEADEDTPGWRYQSEFPAQGTAASPIGLICAHAGASDTARTLTLKGLTSSGTYKEQAITLSTGATDKDFPTTTWAELWYAEVDAACVADVVISKKTPLTTITTIPAGDLSIGSDIATAKPTGYVLAGGKTIEWNTPPDADYTAWVRGGAMPSDFPTDIASLAAATTVPDALPDEWLSVLINGTAALAESIDLESEAAAGRLSIIGQAFMSDIQGLAAMLNSRSRDRGSAINVTAGWER